MATIEEQLLSYLNNAVKPSEIPVLTSLTGTEFNLVYNPSTNKIERVLVSGSSSFITIGDNVFRLLKGYTGSVRNININIEVNDIISNAVIRNNNVNLHIISAIYIGGDITDFGVYDAISKTFSGGSYIYNNYLEI